MEQEEGDQAQQALTEEEIQSLKELDKLIFEYKMRSHMKGFIKDWKCIAYQY